MSKLPGNILSALTRLNITVVGRVQGVGFRLYVEEQASRLELVGYVRNDPYDRRRLEAVAEGARADLEALLKAVEIGPPGARVEGVQTGWESGQGTFTSFKVEL